MIAKKGMFHGEKNRNVLKMQKNIHTYIPNTVFSVIIFSMFSIGSYGTPLPLFHLSQHFFFRLKKTEEKENYLECKVLSFLSYKPMKNSWLLVNFLDKYYFLQNGFWWGTTLFEMVFGHLAYITWSSDPINAWAET